MALWESDNDAVQSICQREGNYLSVLRTNQKRMEATLGPRIFPRDRNVQQLYAHCALNTSFYPFHCAIIALPLSRDRNVQQLYTHCALNRCFYPFHCTCHIALPLRFVGLFALILRPHCAATETVALMIHFKVLFRCFQLLHNAFMLRFHFRLTFLPHYIVLVRAPTRCACFKHILKGASGFCA